MKDLLFPHIQFQETQQMSNQRNKIQIFNLQFKMFSIGVRKVENNLQYNQDKEDFRRIRQKILAQIKIQFLELEQAEGQEEYLLIINKFKDKQLLSTLRRKEIKDLIDKEANRMNRVSMHLMEKLKKQAILQEINNKMLLSQNTQHRKKVL